MITIVIRALAVFATIMLLAAAIGPYLAPTPIRTFTALNALKTLPQPVALLTVRATRWQSLAAIPTAWAAAQVARRR
jgi:hypothetical protein